MMWWVEGVKEIVNTSLSRKEAFWLIYSHNQLITLLLSVCGCSQPCTQAHFLLLVCMCAGGTSQGVTNKPFQRESSKEILNTNGSSVQLSSALVMVLDHRNLSCLLLHETKRLPQPETAVLQPMEFGAQLKYTHTDCNTSQFIQHRYQQ